MRYRPVAFTLLGMKNFHGAPIQVGDVLHDVLDGPMTVTDVVSRGIRAIKGGNVNTTRFYDYNGVLAGRRSRPTLFWHDPIVVTPRKDAYQWLAQLSALRSMCQLLGDFAQSSDYQYRPEHSVEKLRELGLLSDQQSNDLVMAELERGDG